MQHLSEALRARRSGSTRAQVPGARALTLRVAEAAVADARAAPPLHRAQVFVVPEVTLLHGGREVLDHGVELAQHVAQIVLVCNFRCNIEQIIW